MGSSKKYIALGVIAIVFIAVVISASVLSNDDTGPNASPDDCILVLGPTGLYCGERVLASAENDRLDPISRENLKAIWDEQRDETSLIVRSEVPYDWLRHVLEGLAGAGADGFVLRLESSVCGDEDKGGWPAKLDELKTSIETRWFEANIVPRSDVEREDGPDIVRVQPFGVAYEFGELSIPPSASCDKEILTYCKPNASPGEFLEGFATLRRAAQETEEHPLGSVESLERRRIDTARLARGQYPFETMRGQLGAYWSGVQLEVLDEIPTAIVLETIDALVYQRTPGEPSTHSENVPNSLELRCQVPKNENLGVLLLAYSKEFGVTLSERKKSVPIKEQSGEN